jgi:hypothetical protein
MYGVGVRFLPEKHLQPLLSWYGGAFISQNRQQGLYTRTGWNAIGLGLRIRPLKRWFSPIAEVGAHRFTLSVRDKEGRTPRGLSAAQAAIGLSGGLGLALKITEGVEFSLTYHRYRPQTNTLEGIAGPRKDRIESFIGTLFFYFPSISTTKSRFQ